MFDFLFHRKTKSEAVATPAAVAPPAPSHEEEEEVYITKRLDQGMPIEVLDANMRVSFRARVITETNVDLTLGRLPGAMALKELDIGSKVTMSAYNRDLEHVRIKATVVTSSILKLKVRDWTLEVDRSKRSAKRLPTEIQARLYTMEDKHMSNPVPCVVRDLSESGARITTQETLSAGDIMRLQLEVFKGDGLISMPSQVVWSTSQDGIECECGLIFAEMETRRQTELRRSLKTLHDQIVRTTKR